MDSPSGRTGLEDDVLILRTSRRLQDPIDEQCASKHNDAWHSSLSAKKVCFRCILLRHFVLPIQEPTLPGVSFTSDIANQKLSSIQISFSVNFQFAPIFPVTHPLTNQTSFLHNSGINLQPADTTAIQRNASTSNRYYGLSKKKTTADETP